MELKVRQVARGIFILKDKVLLAKSIGKDNYHLPGGGINKYESAVSALLREIKEELNEDAQVIDFIGIIENFWIEKEFSIYETNFLFRIKILKNESEGFFSNENRLLFDWVALSDINSINLKPECVKKGLEQIYKKNIKSMWFSNFT